MTPARPFPYSYSYKSIAKVVWYSGNVKRKRSSGNQWKKKRVNVKKTGHSGNVRKRHGRHSQTSWLLKPLCEHFRIRLKSCFLKFLILKCVQISTETLFLRWRINIQPYLTRKFPGNLNDVTSNPSRHIISLIGNVNGSILMQAS